VLSKPHGGRLIQRMSHNPERDCLLDDVKRLPRLDISPTIARHMPRRYMARKMSSILALPICST
jgi:hypothetical protein